MKILILSFILFMAFLAHSDAAYKRHCTQNRSYKNKEIKKHDRLDTSFKHHRNFKNCRYFGGSLVPYDDGIADDPVLERLAR